MEKLEYFNQMHIRNRFESKIATGSWRQMLLENLPEDVHEQIKKLSDEKMGKIMDLMKVRIHFFRDMAQHQYFFVKPVYESEIAEKFFTKLK